MIRLAGNTKIARLLPVQLAACSLQLAACIEFFFPIHTLLVLSHVTLSEYQLILAQA